MWCVSENHPPKYMTSVSVLVARFEDDSRYPLTIEVFDRYTCFECGSAFLLPRREEELCMVIRKFTYEMLTNTETLEWISKADYFIDKDAYDKAVAYMAGGNEYEDTLR